ncbi:6-hydroxymethylpterin diphosphokinase MptE-like protein [Rubritalea spongiae]|uniref:6-hydroxymethylpterin diphosphokinase MptE-like protein n=1 Tax=Rubritalea spongiae TaxID=430797 RepID=A0ABW5E795_9BACT
MRKYDFSVNIERESDTWNFFCKSKLLGKASSAQSFYKNESLKKSILICGSGPSLNHFDWDSLNLRETTIVALNGANYKLLHYSITPDLHFITDKNFILSNQSSIQSSLQAGTTMVVSPTVASHLYSHFDITPSQKVYIVELVNSWFGVKKERAEALIQISSSALLYNLDKKNVLDDKILEKSGWSKDPQYGVFSGATVAYSALQFFDFAACKSIDMIGVDLTGAKRCYKETHTQQSQLDRDFDRIILPAFTFMKSAPKRTASILNLSKCSRLPFTEL